MRHVAETVITKGGNVRDGRVSRRVTTSADRRLVVTLAPEGIYLREKGRRVRYLLPYGVAFVRAATLHVESNRAARKLVNKSARAASKAHRAAR